MIRSCLVRTALNRKHARLEKLASGIFEQRRILHLPDDVLIDAARLGRVEQLRLGQLVADLHLELVDLGVLRDGEEIGAFDRAIGGIEEFLVDGGGGDLPGDADVDLVGGHLERGENRMVRDRDEVPGLGDHDEAVGAGQGGREGEQESAEERTKCRVHAGLVGNGPIIAPGKFSGNSKFETRNSKKTPRFSTKVPNRCVAMRGSLSFLRFDLSLSSSFEFRASSSVAASSLRADVFMNNDKSLLRRCRAGDGAAWDELFDHYYPVAFRFVFQLSGDFSREDTEEICQETFVAVVRGLASFDGRSAFQTWLLRIASNKAFDFRSRLVAAKRGGGLIAGLTRRQAGGGGSAFEPASPAALRRTRHCCSPKMPR